MSGSADRSVALVTGFPTSFLAARVVRRLLRDGSETHVRIVVPPRFEGRAREELAALAPDAGDRVMILSGDAAAMDLGLSGPEYMALAGEVNVIHHCAAITYLGVARDRAEHVNLQATREVLELADTAPHLSRLVHWSTALVVGARRGYVLEDDLDDRAGFRNVIEETRSSAERAVRRRLSDLPATILRPGIIVGDSVTGEIDRLDGPYLLIALMLSAPSEMRIPLPANGEIPLNLVPIDYVVEAGIALANDVRAVGRAFHLVDPDPRSIRQVFEMIAEAVGRPVPRGSFLPTSLAAALLRTPGLTRFAHVPRAFLDQLTTDVVYDDRNSRELLVDHGIRCPPFESYVQTMVAQVRRHQQRDRFPPAPSAGPTDNTPTSERR